MSLSGPRRLFSSSSSVSRLCLLSCGVPLVTRGLLPLRLRTFRFEGKRDVKVSCRILKRGNLILLFGRRLGIICNIVIIIIEENNKLATLIFDNKFIDERDINT